MRPPSDGSLVPNRTSSLGLQPVVPPAAAAAVAPVVHIDLTDEAAQQAQGDPVKPSLPEVHPIARSSLALLQKSEALERRASKRFSSYTFNKMLPTSSPGNKKTTSGIGSPPRPARRSDRIPAMPAVIEDHFGRPGPVEDLQSGTSPEDSLQPTEGVAPPNLFTGSLPSVAGRALDSGEGGESPALGTSSTLISTPKVSPTSVRAFLQLGRQVKKATIDLPLTMSALRLLFMERFEYDPGMEDFPNVYIRDNKTGVQYELEDMEDVVDGCVLALDFEREWSRRSTTDGST